MFVHAFSFLKIYFLTLVSVCIYDSMYDSDSIAEYKIYNNSQFKNILKVYGLFSNVERHFYINLRKINLVDLNFKMRIKTKISSSLCLLNTALWVCVSRKQFSLWSPLWKNKKFCHKSIVLCVSLGQLVESLPRKREDQNSLKSPGLAH